MKASNSGPNEMGSAHAQNLNTQMSPRSADILQTRVERTNTCSEKVPDVLPPLWGAERKEQGETRCVQA